MARKTWSHVDDPHAVGRRLRAARERAGLSQRQLSFPGCTAAYISRVESGDRIPSLQLLREIGKRLGVSADWIATGTESDLGGDPLAQAELALRIGDVRTAEKLFTAGRDAPDPQVRAQALAGLGRVSLLDGEAALAVSRLEEARAALGPDAAARLPELVEALAEAYGATGEPAQAARTLDDALTRAGADAIVSAQLSVALAGALVEAGDTARADALLDGASSALAALGDPTAAARLRQAEADRASAAGEPALAARYARQALGALEFRDGARLAVEAAHLRASLELLRGNAAGALELLEASPGADDPAASTLLGLDRARALLALGRVEEARAIADELTGTGGSIPDGAGQASVLLADALAGAGDGARAISLYELAAETLARAPASRRAAFYRRWSDLLEAEGRTSEALELLRQAVAREEGEAPVAK